jgi:hypothetical protein
MMNANLILLSKISLMVVGKKDNFVDPVIHNNDNDNNNDIIAIGYTQRMAFALKARKIISESKWQLNTVTTKIVMKTWLHELNVRMIAMVESIARTTEFRQVHGKK